MWRLCRANSSRSAWSGHFKLCLESQLSQLQVDVPIRRLASVKEKALQLRAWSGGLLNPRLPFLAGGAIRQVAVAVGHS